MTRAFAVDTSVPVPVRIAGRWTTNQGDEPSGLKRNREALERLRHLGPRMTGRPGRLRAAKAAAATRERVWIIDQIEREVGSVVTGYGGWGRVRVYRRAPPNPNAIPNGGRGGGPRIHAARYRTLCDTVITKTLSARSIRWEGLSHVEHYASLRCCPTSPLTPPPQRA